MKFSAEVGSTSLRHSAKTDQSLRPLLGLWAAVLKGNEWISESDRGPDLTEVFGWVDLEHRAVGSDRRSRLMFTRCPFFGGTRRPGRLHWLSWDLNPVSRGRALNEVGVGCAERRRRAALPPSDAALACEAQAAAACSSCAAASAELATSASSQSRNAASFG
jgi:hypothetical protein